MWYTKERKLSFFIALAYVSIGTLSVCSIYPDDPFYNEWFLVGLVFTFPVTIVSFGYRYAEGDLLYPVFIIQAIMFVLTFFILSHLLKVKNKLKIAIENENEKILIESLDFRQKQKIGADDYDLLEKALIGTWHSRHEDLVSLIWLKGLVDDRFVDPILNIALNQEVYRWYDDELEQTLRKCVHALKIIDSEKANMALKKLQDLNNDNVNFALDMYD